MFNDRQVALLLWVAVVVGFCAMAQSIRPSLLSTLRSLLHWKILSILVLLGAWAIGLVFLGRKIGVWTEALAGDSWIWFFTTAVIILFNFTKASHEADFFIEASKETFGLTLFLGFVSDLYVLPLPIEFVGQGVLALLAGMAAVAAGDASAEPARKLVDGCLSTVGLMFLGLALLNLVNNWSADEAPGLLRQLLMPVWMTLGVLPFVYAVALYASYEQVFTRIDGKARSRRVRLRAKAAVVVGLRSRATLVAKFTGLWPDRAADAPSHRGALQVIDEFENYVRRQEQDKQEAADRLVRFAGIDGVDDQGMRLDRREFAETTVALRWIATCQMGWSRRTGYRADILDVVGDLSRHGLPGNGGIEVRVGVDGSSWYAWRRTITGWVFAIGAAGPPPDQWEYDGPEPPTGFPGESSDWGPRPFVDDANPNW